MLYAFLTPVLGCHPVRWFGTGDLQRTIVMAAQLIHLATQIQRWLDQSVARHLAAQAERFEPAKH